MLNCSILDGWWDECFDGDERLGDRVGRGRATTSTKRDEIEANEPVRAARAPDRAALLRPRREGRCPGAGCDAMKHNWRRSGPYGHRRPHGARLRHRALRAGGRQRPSRMPPTAAPPARDAGRVEAARARRRGPACSVAGVESSDTDARAELGARRDGSTRRPSTSARSPPTTSTVQLLHGPVGAGRRAASTPRPSPLEHVATDRSRRAWSATRAAVRVRRSAGPLRLHRAGRAPATPTSTSPRRARPHRLGLS